ncbi:MAG TPA: hypothetical protein VLE96_03555 [Chlamydiales bacterium]|nr:hypothetical protein [Chlamydiales bacterium]
MLKIREDILDCSSRGAIERKGWAEQGELLQISGTLGQVSNTICTLVGLILFGNFRLIGLCLMSFGVLGFVASRDVSLLGKNVQNLMNSNLLQRSKCVASAENLTDSLIKETLICNLFRQKLIRSFEGCL